jgi:hypothetical protein
MSPALVRAVLVACPVLGVAVCSLAGCGSDSTQPPPAAETLRGCRSAVYGEIAPKARRKATVAGPLELLASAVEPDGVAKVLVVLRAGKAVTLAVPESERRRLSLLYDESAPGPPRPLRFSDGVSTVRFSACPEGVVAGTKVKGASESQFNGGFFVRGAHCGPLEVWIKGREEPLRRWLPFGTGTAPCPPRGSDTR